METPSLVSVFESRCALCRSFSIASCAGGEHFKHYETLTELKSSAKSGCDLCRLFWHCMTYTPEDDAAVHDAMTRRQQQICVNSNATNMRLMPELGGHSAYDALWITCGAENDPVERVGIWGQAELFTSRKGRMSSFFRGRDVSRNPASEENFDDIKRWLQQCSHHQFCERPCEAPLPKRLLNVGSLASNSIRLEITEGKIGRYLALSYCWGTSPSTTTTSVSLKEHLSGIAISELPATLADAVHITRRLGIQYLWIDALCILQARFPNDQEAITDWQDQSLKMADIYGNAFLTISAAEASDKSEGILQLRPLSSYTCEVALDERQLSMGLFARLPALSGAKYQGRYNSPLEKRAWTFQEASLSHRVLRYTKQGIFWICRSGEYTEQGDLTAWNDKRGMTQSTGPQLFSDPAKRIDKLENTNTLERTNPGLNHINTRDHFLVNWYSSLETSFCGRLLTNDADMMPALSGVANKIQSVLGGEYYAGLWEIDFLRGLLWKPANILPRSKDTIRTRPTVYRAPSWSWASLNGPIYYGCTLQTLKRWDKESNRYPAKILGVTMVFVGPGYHPMGQLAGGSLQISAPSKIATTVPKSSNPFMMHWVDNRGEKRHYKPALVWHLLISDEAADETDPLAVTALGAFDTKDPPPSKLFCILLTLKEGLMLELVDGKSLRYERVGYFKLHQEDWFDGCQSKLFNIF